MAALELERLSASYGRARVLFDVDLKLDAGEVVVLAGRNGAGKSTTLKAVMGLVRPDSGAVLFGGRRIDGLQPFEIARLGLGYVPEDRRIFTDLTVAENLEVGRKAPREGIVSWTAERLFALFPPLAAMRERLAAQMSGGEQQMLTIARTLMGNPAALLLDEPSEGLAPKVVQAIEKGRVGDRAYFLEQGHARHAGPMSELQENLLG